MALSLQSQIAAVETAINGGAHIKSQQNFHKQQLMGVKNTLEFLHNNEASFKEFMHQKGTVQNV